MNRFFSQRRCLLQALVAAPALFSRGVAAADASLTTTALADTLTLIEGAGGNVVLYKDAAGAALVDSGEANKTAALLALVESLSAGAALTTVFNTHWHEDHSGGNEALHARGATLVAHENTKLWLGAAFDVDWRQWSHTPRPAAALPQKTFYTSTRFALGNTTVELLHYPQAHTDGDLCVYFRDANVLVAGGLMTHKRYPLTDIATGGWIGGLLSANQALLDVIDDNTLIVPDRGQPLRKADLAAQVAMLSDLYEQMKEMARNGLNDQDMLNEKLTAKYDAVWGSPDEFVRETYRGMWAHTYDMGGFI